MSAMSTRLLLILATLPLLSGCVVTPRFEISERYNFSYPSTTVPVVAPTQQLSTEDVMCQA